MMWLSFVLSVGFAQTDTYRSEAEALFEKAREHMKSGHAVEACPLFEKSFQLEPALGTLLNLAACWEAVGKNAQAYLSYNEASEWAARLKDHRREQWAFSRSQAMKPRLSWLALRAQAPPPGLRVKVLDQTHALSTSPLVLPVDVGEILVTLTAPQYQDVQQTLSVKSVGETVTFQVPVMTPKEALAVPLKVETKAPLKVVSKNGPWFALSGGLALTAAGAAGLWWSYSTYEKLQNQRMGAENAPGDAAPVTRADFSRLQVIYPVSWAAVGVGTATALVSTWLLVQKEDSKTHLAFVPIQDGAWLSVQREF